MPISSRPTTANGATEKLYFDAESGLLVRRDFERVTVDDGIVLYEVDYEDYKDVDGLKLRLNHPPQDAGLYSDLSLHRNQGERPHRRREVQQAG